MDGRRQKCFSVLVTCKVPSIASQSQPFAKEIVIDRERFYNGFSNLEMLPNGWRKIEIHCFGIHL